MDAARFLKKSQLSDVILSKIWDMADPQSRGSLDKSGLFVALKLCALAQTGKDLNMSNLSLELPPPKMVKQSLYIYNQRRNIHLCISFYYFFVFSYFREISQLFHKRLSRMLCPLLNLSTVEIGQ